MALTEHLALLRHCRRHWGLERRTVRTQKEWTKRRSHPHGDLRKLSGCVYLLEFPHVGSINRIGETQWIYTRIEQHRKSFLSKVQLLCACYSPLSQDYRRQWEKLVHQHFDVVRMDDAWWDIVVNGCPLTGLPLATVQKARPCREFFFLNEKDQADFVRTAAALERQMLDCEIRQLEYLDTLPPFAKKEEGAGAVV